jgi:hypothetical protein
LTGVNFISLSTAIAVEPSKKSGEEIIGKRSKKVGKRGLGCHWQLSKQQRERRANQPFGAFLVVSGKDG